MFLSEKVFPFHVWRITLLFTEFYVGRFFFKNFKYLHAFYSLSSLPTYVVADQKSVLMLPLFSIRKAICSWWLHWRFPLGCLFWALGSSGHRVCGRISNCLFLLLWWWHLYCLVFSESPRLELDVHYFRSFACLFLLFCLCLLLLTPNS